MSKAGVGCGAEALRSTKKTLFMAPATAAHQGPVAGGDRGAAAATMGAVGTLLAPLRAMDHTRSALPPVCTVRKRSLSPLNDSQELLILGSTTGPCRAWTKF